jgi:hypothetical protein
MPVLVKPKTEDIFPNANVSCEARSLDSSPLSISIPLFTMGYASLSSIRDLVARLTPEHLLR